ncbi:MAG TPA: hypothetical protein VJ875_15265 [Pyrinomonadaceae bacterium]|nr:hypothetical protein [Pyrinomonadaceae bacterium]
MHNCSETKEQITELLLDGADRSPDDALSAELRGCAECRAEFSSLSAVLRITNRLKATASAAEGYWSEYHARLQQKLFHAKAQSRRESHRPSFATLRLCVSFLVRSFKASIRVPVPLGLALLITFLVLGFLAIRSARQQVAPAPSTAVVHVPVEVPVVQEKIVTRVVYRDRRSKASQRLAGPARADSTFAKSQKPKTEDLPASLLGFKPTDEIKLTVIKGGSSNER